MGLFPGNENHSEGKYSTMREIYQNLYKTPYIFNQLAVSLDHPGVGIHHAGIEKDIGKIPFDTILYEQYM